MKRGDLVKVKASHEIGLTAYPRAGRGRVWVHIASGEVSMLLHDMKADDVGGYIDVLHPKHGICAILRKALEAV